MENVQLKGIKRERVGANEGKWLRKKNKAAKKRTEMENAHM